MAIFAPLARLVAGLVDRALTKLLGPRDSSVIIEDGFYFAVQSALVWEEGDTVVASGLRWGTAVRTARRLRQQAEDRPQAVL